jgi:Ca2+-binding RTX toxin-like protein
MRHRRILAIAASSSLICVIGVTAPAASAHRADCTILGTDHRDRLIGTPGSDVICGFGGNDTLRGRGGADVLYGGRGGDELNGGVGPDVMFGGTGSDGLNPGDGDDTARGGRGNDAYFGSAGDDRVSGGPGRDFLWEVGGGIDLLRGGPALDCLFTDDLHGADVIVGGAGNDRWEADSTDTVLSAEVEDPGHCD